MRILRLSFKDQLSTSTARCFRRYTFYEDRLFMVTPHQPDIALPLCVHRNIKKKIDGLKFQGGIWMRSKDIAQRPSKIYIYYYFKYL